MARQQPNAARRAGQFLAGLTALLTLVVLLLGVPIMLAKLAGDPLPQTPPSLSGIWHALTARDDGQLFLRVLTLVAWGAWAAFTLAVLMEIPAAIRRRPARRLPGLRLPQRAAANLIAAVALMLQSPAVASAATALPMPAAPTPAAVVTTVVTPTGSHGLPILNQRGPVLLTAATAVAPARAYANTPAAQLVYNVHRGDWLGYIAERFLGDFDRYHDIQRLNPDLIQNPNVIYPDTQFLLPSDAYDRGARAHATGHVVAPPTGADHSPADASGGKPRDPGSPAISAPSTSPSPTPSASASANTSPSTSPSAGATPSPSSAPGATSTRPRGAATAPTTGAANGHLSAEDGSMLDQALAIGVPLFGAGLLATLLLARLRRRRQRQEQHRPVGRRLPEPISPKIETQMRVVAEPVAVDRLDHALRVLAAGLLQRPAEQMPDIVGVWLTGHTINLLLTGPCPNPPAPWTDDQLTWTLPADVPLPEADGQLAPLPTLVTVGSQPGMHLLLDLERLGLLTITGDPGRAADLLRYLAAELSLNAWSDHIEVTIAGFDATETGELLALDADRIGAAPNVATAIDRIRRRAGQVVQSLDHLDAGDPLTGRIKDIAADAWMPHVLLVNDPDPQDVSALEALDNDLAATGRCAVAIAVTNSDPVGRWPVAIDADGLLNVGFLGMSAQDAMTAARLPRVELTNLADLLSTARRAASTEDRPGQSDHDAERGWSPVPPAPETELWAQGTDANGALLTEQPEQQSRAWTESMDEDDAADNEHDPTDDEAPQSADEIQVVSVALPTEQDQPPATQPDLPASASGVVGDDEPSKLASPTSPGEGADVPPVAALVGRQPARKRISAPVRGRRHNDPTLDTDLRAWTEADPTRPRIAILGPVTVEAPGQLPDERVRFYAEIVVYLATRGQRGATTDQFDDAIWPDQAVKANTRRVAVARARRWLGEAFDGQPWLPDATTDRRYRLRDGFLLDWHLFRRLRSRGEARGPAGASDLRDALSLVRGAPLASADVAYSAVARNPYVWLPASGIQPHHLAAAVVDSAHRLVELCLDGGDIAGARWAVDQAWLADPGRASDIAWRDLLQVAAAEGNTAELDQLLGELMNARDAEVPEDLDAKTYRLLCDLMPERMRAGVR